MAEAPLDKITRWRADIDIAWLSRSYLARDRALHTMCDNVLSISRELGSTFDGGSCRCSVYSYHSNLAKDAFLV